MAMKIHSSERDIEQQELLPEEQTTITRDDMQTAYDDLSDYLGSDVFPIDALPIQVQTIIKEISENKCCQEEMIFMHLLALTSACTGSALTVCPHEEIHSTWREPCTLWGMIVAESGEAKSPTMKLIFRALEKIQLQVEERYNEEYKQYLEYAKQWNEKEEHDESDVAPIEPSKKQYFVDDTTIEALHAILLTNKHGILWRKDEIRGLLKNLNKYNKGDSIDILLALYSGFNWPANRSSKKDRGSQASDTVVNALTSIYGGIQPGVLEKFFSQDDVFSGLVQRFLFCFLDKRKKKTLKTKPISHNVLSLLENLTEDMLRSRGKQRTVYLTEEAFEVYNDFYETIANHKPQSFMMKSTNNCLRIALALYQLEVRSCTGEMFYDSIDERQMKNAVTITKWFLVTLFKNIIPLLEIKKSKSEDVIKKDHADKEFLQRWIKENITSLVLPLTSSEIMEMLPKNHPFKNGRGKPSSEILGRKLTQAGYRKDRLKDGQRVYILNDLEYIPEAKGCVVPRDFRQSDSM